MKYIFLFILLLPGVSAEGFGVHPPSIQGFEDEIIIVNGGLGREFFIEASDGVFVNQSNLYVESGGKATISVEAKNTGTIEVRSGDDFLVPGVVVSVSVPQETELERKLKGIGTVLFINLIGICVGGVVWKKKRCF